MTILFLILLIALTSNISYACSIPKPGFGWNKDDLIEKSKYIVLVKVNSIKIEKSGTKYTLSPVRTLKGQGNDKDIVFWSYSEKHHGNDFNFHKDGEFWMPNIGRSEFPCCICGPDHTFKKGEMYLLFPDAMGSMKSGEIIKDTEKDEWYNYVIDRVSG